MKHQDSGASAPFAAVRAFRQSRHLSRCARRGELANVIILVAAETHQSLLAVSRLGRDAEAEEADSSPGRHVHPCPPPSLAPVAATVQRICGHDGESQDLPSPYITKHYYDLPPRYRDSAAFRFPTESRRFPFQPQGQKR